MFFKILTLLAIFWSELSFANSPLELADTLISSDEFKATVEEFKHIKQQEQSPEVLQIAQEQEENLEAFKESSAFKANLKEAKELDSVVTRFQPKERYI